MAVKQRIEFIDLAKGVCILLVLMLHIAPELERNLQFLSCLRMPLYYTLSGLFFKDYGSLKNLLQKKTDRLIIPFFGWYIIGYLIYYVRLFLFDAPETSTDIRDLFLGNDFYNMSIWFLLSIFWCNLFYGIISLVSSNVLIRLMLVAAATGCGWLMDHFELGNYLFIACSLTCLPFFYFGTLIKSTPLLYESNSRKTDLFMLVAALGVAAAAILLSSEPIFMSFYTNHLKSGDPVIFYICGISLVLATLILCKFVKRVYFVSYLGRFSIIVLVTHSLLLNILNRSITHIYGNNMDELAYHLCLLAVITLLMAAVIPICRRFLPYICAQKGLMETLLKKEPDNSPRTSSTFPGVMITEEKQ